MRSGWMLPPLALTLAVTLAACVERQAPTPTGAETPMPSFAPLLDGDLVGYDGGDGIASPTPVRLVQVAEYLKSLQE